MCNSAFHNYTTNWWIDSSINIVLFIGFVFLLISMLPGTYYLDNLFLTSNKSIASFLFCLVFFFY